MDRLGAIILGIEYQSLGLLRQLATAGIPCVLVDQDRWGAAIFSRHCVRFHRSPPYTCDEFWPWLVALAQREGYEKWLLIPTDDEQVRQISLRFEQAKRLFHVFGMPWTSYEIVYNKRRSFEWCQQQRIETPKSFLPEHRSHLPGPDFEFPCIIKPAFRRNYSRHCRAKAIPVESRRELIDTLATRLQPVPIEDLLYQQIIPGNGEHQWSYAGLFVEGEPKAAFTARRRRQHPPDFGRASTYVEAVHDPEVERESRRVLSLLRYTGLAEVEWKRDVRDGRLNFLEVNARCWGWHSLAVRVVGNLAVMLHDQLMGQPVATVTPDYGCRWVKHITDVPVVLHLWLRRELSLREYFRSLRNPVVCCEWERNDPWPFFLQFFLAGYLLKRRGY
jgi:predicted ATP-grasp superfamily ATP-dependent carboligase